MGIEEDLLNALKYFDLKGGKAPNVRPMIDSLMRKVQVNTLREFQVKLAGMQEDINKLIAKLSVPSGSYDKNLDPFFILGVSPDATKDEVEKAYKKKARAAHPDVGGENKDMVLINAAYEVIKRLKGW